MPDKITIGHTDGSSTVIDSQALIINPGQQINVMGLDFNKFGGWENVVGQTPGYNTSYCGKLKEQGYLLRSQIVNSLSVYNWDFDKNPNPEIIIISKDGVNI